MALLVGYGEGVDRIDKRTIKEVAKDLEGIHIKGDEKAESVRYHQALENVSCDNEHSMRKTELKEQISPKARAIPKQKRYTGIRYFD